MLFIKSNSNFISEWNFSKVFHLYIGAKKLLWRGGKKTQGGGSGTSSEIVWNKCKDKRRNSGDLWVAFALVYVANEKSERREVEWESASRFERGLSMWERMDISGPRRSSTLH